MENNKVIINQGYCERFDEVATVKVLDKKTNPILSIFYATPRKRPIKIDYLEMHPLASQAFMPIQKIDWQVVVANDNNGSPDLSSIKYFKVPGDVGINYNSKVWHFPLLVNKAQDFLVIDRSSALDQSNENLREFFFQSNDKSIYIE
jgi:ureidoglycolate lyase